MSLTAHTADEVAFRDMPTDSKPVDHVPAELIVPEPVVLEDAPSRLPREPALRRLPMPRQGSRWTGRISWTAIAVGVAALYLFALLSFWAPANPGVDQNGYLVGGRQFAHTFSTGIVLKTPYDFIGRMWVTAPSGENYPKYPLGLPILYAGAIWLQSIFHWNGYEVGQLVSPLGATFALLGIFAIVRRLTDSGFAGVLAMILLGTDQVMLTLADNPNSHAAGTGTILWGVYFLFRFLETGALWRGLCAGFLLGFAYLIRYTDGLMVLLLGSSLLYMAKWRRPSWRVLAIGVGSILLGGAIAFVVGKFYGARLAARWPAFLPLRAAEGVNRPAMLLLVAVMVAAFTSLFVQPRAWWRLFLVGGAWLVPVLYQTIFNMVAMQSFTSYAGTNESTGFTLDDFTRNWELMVRTLHDQALFFIAPLGLLGLLAMVRRMPFIAGLLALWFFPSVLLYTAYYWAPDNRGVSYSRFILTSIPALIISASWLLAEIMRRQGRTSWRLSPIATTIVASLGVLVGLAMIGVTAVYYAHPKTEPLFWAIAIPGALLVVAGGVTIVGRFITREDDAVAPHFRGWVPRLAVGAIVFVAAGVSLYRTAVGSEWGQQMQPRASIETQARQNMNLWGLGKQVRAIVPDGAVLIADGDRMHHFQWLGDWRMYFTEYFELDRVRRSLNRMGAAGEADPDPIDQSRIDFLQTVYKDKDQSAVRNDMNNLIGDAIKANTPVYYALPNGAADAFARNLDRHRFDVKTVGTYQDVPSPRLDEDFLPPAQRPRMMNRFGGARQLQANALLAANERQSYRIVQIVAATPPPPPAPKPTPTPKPQPVAAKPAPATRPTTRPATHPALPVTPATQPTTRP